MGHTTSPAPPDSPPSRASTLTSAAQLAIAQRHARWPIVAVFVLSGAAGLVYEVVWARQLVLVFGNTTQAVSVILTGYFGGMAAGSYLGGRLADRLRAPLLLYGLLEILVAAVALATPATFLLVHDAYRGAYGTLQSAPAVLTLIRFVLCLLALGPATLLMGATLPTLTRYLTQYAGQLHVAFGRLYAANTLGAVMGSAVSGLVLIELLGLAGAVRAGAACSALAGIIALGLQWRWGSRPSGAGPVPAPARPTGDTLGPSAEATARPRLALAVAFLSGLTSLGYQTLWTRLLSSGTGDVTYVFTVILTVFLIGLALGAALYNDLRRRVRDLVTLLAVLQALIALLAVTGLLTVIAHPQATTDLHLLIEMLGVSALLVVLPATVVMGFTLPLTTGLLGNRDRHVGADTGRLLAANTLGAITGTFGVPFVLIPLLGSPQSVAVLALLNAGAAFALGLYASVRQHHVRVGLSALSLVACVLAAVTLARGGLVDPTVVRVESSGGQIWASAEDEIASVQAGTLGGLPQLWVAGTSMTSLTIDVRLMPLLPLMLRPAARSALTIAFGMGSAFREALRAGLHTDAVELVPSVPKMFRYFYPDATQLLADPNGRVIVDDGRNYVELTDRAYDIIVVDPPPPPQSSGASIISSLEFYQAASRRLTAGGVMMQWVPYGQTIDDIRAHIRTFRHVFPHVIVAVGPGNNGIFMLGSGAPLAFTNAGVLDVLQRPGITQDLSFAFDSPVRGMAAWADLVPRLVVLSGSGVLSFAGPGPLVTDDRPLPEYFLLRSLFGPPSPPILSFPTIPASSAP